MRKRVLLAVAALAAAGSWAAPATTKPAVDIAISQGRADGLYAAGETATFRVEVKDAAGQPLRQGSIRWIVDDFGTNRLSTGSADLATGNVFTVTGTRRDPGFVRLIAYQGKVRKDAGAGFDVTKIRQNEPRPADFDAYWAGEKARLAREVPLNPSCEKLPASDKAKWDTYLIGFDTFNRKRLWGFMTIPKDRAKAPFRARIRICDAGAGTTGPWEGNDGEVTATLNVFGFKPAKDGKGQKELYDQLNKDLKARYGTARYCTSGIAVSREDYYFHDAMLGLSRAVDWIADRPEVDPKRLVYFGSSQGGGFGLYVTYLNGRFSRACFAVPACTGHFGYKQGRQDGWPTLVQNQQEADRAAAERNAAYFDGVNFAAALKIPVRFIVGFIDGCCPPHAVYSAFNACPSSDKAIINAVPCQHGDWGKWIYSHLDAPSCFDYNAWLRER